MEYKDNFIFTKINTLTDEGELENGNYRIKGFKKGFREGR